jgi:hypothetical protein
MFVSEDGHVSGSIDRAQVAELLAATDDEELKAEYRALLGESEEAPAGEAEAAAEPEAEDLSSLKKAELVEKAQAAGIDTTGATKADIVAALEEGVTGGDDVVS